MSFRSALRRCSEWAVYPVIVVASAVAAAVMLAAGWPALLAIVAANTGAAALVLVMEWALRYRGAWARSRGDLCTDVCHLVFSSGGAQIVAILLYSLVAAAGARLSRELGASLWPSGLPFGVQLVLALLVAELGYYWLHRLYHRTFLFRLHAVHHSAERIYWLNSNRNHPTDFLLAGLSMSAPLIFLGAGERLFVVVTVIAFSVMLLQHANIAMRLGWLNAVLVGGETHRWHHSRDPVEQDHNFGSVLLVWDVVFGTYFLPRDREPPIDVGLTDMPDFPRDYLGQLISPVTMKRSA
jgi:sterol desaturase/sphingolipid hydroxylase (fatty acid hydroxylase superfamily)